MRQEMLKKAKQLAHEILDSYTSLSDKEYVKMSKLNAAQAIEILAHQFIEEAANSF